MRTLPDNSQFTRLLAMGMLVVALALFAASATLPEQAHAAFNDVADSYPAAQDLGSYGAAIKGDQLPDGAYKVQARTSSRMCIMYTDPADAEARDSKEQAIVTVSGGKMTAVFYISKAYTHLYFGTQEQAAKATNAKGTDASAYIAGDPDEGYVPHMFAIPISALNSPITISTYSGGDKGIEKGKWYTRQVVFKMTDAEFKAATTPEPEPEPAKDQSGKDGNASSQAAEVPSDAAADSEAEKSQQAASSDSSAKSDDSAKAQSNLNAKNVKQSNANNGGANQGWTGTPATPADQPNQDSEQTGESGSSAAAQTASEPKTIRGVRMNIANPEIEIDVSGIEAPEIEEEQPPLLTLPQIIGLAAIALFVIGVAARSVLFARSLDKPTNPANSNFPANGGKRDDAS